MWLDVEQKCNYQAWKYIQQHLNSELQLIIAKQARMYTNYMDSAAWVDNIFSHLNQRVNSVTFNYREIIMCSGRGTSCVGF